MTQLYFIGQLGGEKTLSEQRLTPCTPRKVPDESPAKHLPPIVKYKGTHTNKTQEPPYLKPVVKDMAPFRAPWRIRAWPHWSPWYKKEMRPASIPCNAKYEAENGTSSVPHYAMSKRDLTGQKINNFIDTKDITQPYQTCDSWMGTLLFAQCIIFGNKTIQTTALAEDISSPPWIIKNKIKLESWQADRRLLGPDMTWTTHYNSLHRKEQKDLVIKGRIVISCNRQVCTTLFYIQAVINMELCGEAVCKPNTNGTALVFSSVGNWWIIICCSF